MSSMGLEKTREEILGERADVLSRAGRTLSEILDTLTAQEGVIRKKLYSARKQCDDPPSGRRPSAMCEINKEIRTYNQIRERAQLRYYYLIVTREALGLRRHQWIETLYPIPPKKPPVTGLMEPSPCGEIDP